MNNLYFACNDCKIYIDAGYRWAYWQLEDPGVVSRRKVISVESVLAASNFWNPPKDEISRWLYDEIFPPLKTFLGDHKDHLIVFGDIEDLIPDDDACYLDWMQIGYRMQPTPRYFAEVLGLNTWIQVDQYMETQEFLPAWWIDLPWRVEGKKRFEELIRKKASK
jgi:hypothetical protein